MNKSVRRLLIIVGVLVSAVLVISVAVYFTVGRSQAQSPLPNPNGYDDLAQAARIVSRRFERATSKGSMASIS